MKKALKLLLFTAFTNFANAGTQECSLDEIGDAQQVVHVEATSNFVARVILFEKYVNIWRPIKGPYVAVVGQGGVAALGEKFEGDMKTPRGVFDITGAFGKTPSAKTRLFYRQALSDDKWIDDPTSPDYNTWVRGETTAKSFENLLRPNDNLYDLALTTGYNTNPVIAGKGSAIFVHIWRNSLEGTAGCVALSQHNMERIAEWLDAAKNPKIIVDNCTMPFEARP